MRNVDAKHSGDSWGYRGRWQVNLMNTCATQEDKKDFTVKSIIRFHNILVIHELTHALSGERYCWNRINGKLFFWDAFLMNVVD